MSSTEQSKTTEKKSSRKLPIILAIVGGVVLIIVIAIVILGAYLYNTFNRSNKIVDEVNEINEAYTEIETEYESLVDTLSNTSAVNPPTEEELRTSITTLEDLDTKINDFEEKLDKYNNKDTETYRNEIKESNQLLRESNEVNRNLLSISVCFVNFATASEPLNNSNPTTPAEISAGFAGYATVFGDLNSCLSNQEFTEKSNATAIITALQDSSTQISNDFNNQQGDQATDNISVFVAKSEELTASINKIVTDETAVVTEYEQKIIAQDQVIQDELTRLSEEFTFEVEE